MPIRGPIAPTVNGKIQTAPTNQNGAVFEHNPYGIPEDFREFAKLCQIRSGVDFVPFELFDYQVELSNLIDKHKGLAVLKTRQTGGSEVISCKMLHESLLNPAFLGAAFSLGQQESSKLSDRVGTMPSQIPGFKWAIDSKTARKSEKGGELLFRPATENSARSLASVTWLFFDEAGFPPDISEMYGNATPSQRMVGDSARRILISTLPREGLDCWYGSTFWSSLPFDLEEEIARVQEGRGRHDKGFSYWIDAEGWVRVLLHWHSHPIYSQVPNFLQTVKKEENLTDEQLQREYNLQIPKRGASLFSEDLIKEAAIGTWEDPRPSAKYLLAIDPNFGAMEGDYYQAGIIDVSRFPLRLVAQYRSNETSNILNIAQTLSLLRRYPALWISIEANSGGAVIAESIAEHLGMIRVELGDGAYRYQRSPARVVLGGNKGQTPPSPVRPVLELVRTTQFNKVQNTDRVVTLMEDKRLILPSSWEGLDELRKFSSLQRKGMGTTHDDCVMMLAIAFAQWGELQNMISKWDTSWLRN